MLNREKYDQVYVESFSLLPNVVVTKLAYQSIPEWDSVGHMGLIAGLEEAFDVELDMDDIIDFSSYETGIEIMKKYKIDL